jgi:hypothetical protein
MVFDPGEADAFLPLSFAIRVDFRQLRSSSFPTVEFRGSIPSTFRLTACLLAVLRLKLDVTAQASKDLLPGGWSTFRDGNLTR